MSFGDSVIPTPFTGVTKPQNRKTKPSESTIRIPRWMDEDQRAEAGGRRKRLGIKTDSQTEPRHDWGELLSLAYFRPRSPRLRLLR